MTPKTLTTANWQQLVADAIDDLPPDIAAAVGWRADSAYRVTIALAIPIADEHGVPTDECELLTVAQIAFDAAAGGSLTLDSMWLGAAEFSAARDELREARRRLQVAILELLHKGTACWAEPPIEKQRGMYLRPDGRCVLAWQALERELLGQHRDDESDDRDDDDGGWEEGDEDEAEWRSESDGRHGEDD